MGNLLEATILKEKHVYEKRLVNRFLLSYGDQTYLDVIKEERTRTLLWTTV